MATVSDGTFKDWQDSDVMHANDYVQEREIIRAALNDNAKRVGALEASTSGVALGNVQMKKITDDNGGYLIGVKETTGDILLELARAEKGFYTIYAVSGSKNMPPTKKSIRGIAHITGTNPSFGYVWVVDFDNNFFQNYIDNDVWSGWNGPGVQKVLKDNINWYMNASQTVTPDKPLSKCRTGWELIWSDYDDDGKKVNNFDFYITRIPKYQAADFPGASMLHLIPNSPANIAIKRLYVYDDNITGHDDNDDDAYNNRDVVLRSIREY
jgi:hypothetical protein